MELYYLYSGKNTLSAFYNVDYLKKESSIFVSNMSTNKNFNKL
jgi:hypothetical protein